MASQPDLLFFFSDQHHGLYAGYAGHNIVQTPNLDRIAAGGVAFRQAYTPCPLCVPARSALLCGQLASQTGIFTNSQSLSSDQATFMHSIAAQGYETVLCGRMHFKGPDQRHGFTKRIYPDILPFQGSFEGGEVFHATFSMGGCTDLAGAGRSPVLDYDRKVVDAALDYLAHPHEKPQCLVVGTYGPHFPYVAPPEDFDLYLGHTDVPASWAPEVADPNPLVDAKRQRTRHPPGTDNELPITEDNLDAIRAAYFGMITEQDRLVGRVRDAWHDFLQRHERQGVFLYSSDHGDTCGEHGLFGKQTFYEGSVRVPLLIEGDGIPPAREIDTPVSLLDIAPTLCELAGAEQLPTPDGISLVPCLRSRAAPSERPILSEWLQNHYGSLVAGRMVRCGRWKLMHYTHPEIADRLFDIEKDPDELVDVCDWHPERHEALLSQLRDGWHPEALCRRFAASQPHLAKIHAWEQAVCPPQPASDVWSVPEESKQCPERVF